MTAIRAFFLQIRTLFSNFQKTAGETSPLSPRPLVTRLADTGFPYHAPFSSLKYFVVIPPFVTHDSCSFKNIFIQSIKVLQNPNISRALIRKDWSSESKAFSMSIFSKCSFTFMFLVILSKSEISLPSQLPGLLRWDNIWKYFFQSGSKNFRNNFIIYIEWWYRSPVANKGFIFVLLF